MILPEAEELAREYPLSEDEVSEYVKTGIPLDACRDICAMRVLGLTHGDAISVAYKLAKAYFEKSGEEWGKMHKRLVAKRIVGAFSFPKWASLNDSLAKEREM